MASSAVCAFAIQSPFASDNADNYPNNPDHSWAAYNGGNGYDLWTPVGGISGGGTYMEGTGVNNRQVGGNYSFALYAGSGGYAISRQLANPLATGSFSILTRFDLAGSGPNLFSLRSGNDTTAFGNGELLSFGIVNGNQLSYTDRTGFHAISSGEARGDIWDWTINFDAGTGAYTLSVQDLSTGSYSDTVSGNLESTGTSVDSFAVINSSTGDNQNLVFNSPTFVPEPSTFVLIGLGAAGLCLVRRKMA